jgi:hypothetical protein
MQQRTAHGSLFIGIENKEQAQMPLSRYALVQGDVLGISLQKKQK